MNSTYLWLMGAGSLLVFALYWQRWAIAVRLPQLKKRAWETALLAFLFAAVFGTVLARCGFALLDQELDFEYDGIAALEQLLEFSLDHLSFFCGAAGVCLGVLLANRLTRKGSVWAGMDAFAPFGALLVFLFRMGECFDESWGTGASLPEGSPLAFFPLALKTSADGGYESWSWAVCVLSAVFALAWAAVSFFRLRSSGRTGWNFTLTLFFLALPQVLCESMRSSGIYWLFVHTEQLLCVLVLLGVLLFWILKAGRDLPFARRWAPLGIFLLCTGALIVIEFAIDGSKIKVPGMTHAAWHLVMCAVVAVMGAAGVTAARRGNRQASPVPSSPISAA